MLRLIFRLMLLLIITLALLIGGERTVVGWVYQPTEIDIYICENLCWRGLELGKTTEAELMAFIQENEYSMRSFSFLDEDLELSFDTEHLHVGAAVDNTLTRLTISGADCPIYLLGALGKPNIAQINHTTSITSGTTTHITEYAVVSYNHVDYNLHWQINYNFRSTRIIMRLPDSNDSRPDATGQITDWTRIVNNMHDHC